MKEMLLSFKPEIFDLIRSGKKIYEYRTQFSTEKVRAYMYVSKPVQKIIGYVELGERVSLTEWETKYKEHPDILERIQEYISRNNKYVMPILKFQMTKGISLKQLKKDLDKFIIPQSYYYLDTFPELKEYIHLNLTNETEHIKNTFNSNDYNQICVRKYKV